MRVVGAAADTLMDGVRSPAVFIVYVYAPDFPQIFSVRIQAGRMTEAMA